MTTETKMSINVVGSIDPAELDRLYSLAGRDRNRFASECGALFGIRGIAAMRTEYVAHSHGISAYPAAGPILQILRSDLYEYTTTATR